MTKKPNFDAMPYAKPSLPNAIIHPHPDDKGKPFIINTPSVASSAASWSDPSATAVCVPGGAMPASLHGIAFALWDDHPKTAGGWDYVDGLMPDLVEPKMITKGKTPAAGVVIEEPDGRIWLVNPTNGFAGYTTTFPKGHADDGISLQATAIREAFEESGLQVDIIGLIGDVERGQTMTRYYRARRVGGTPAAMGWETQAVQLVPQVDVNAAVNKAVDRTVAMLAGIQGPSGPSRLVASINAPLPYLGSLAVVNGLVRKFAGDVVGIRMRQNTEELTNEEAQAAVIGLAQAAGAIVLGKNPGYTPMKWNSDRRLGILLRTHYPDADRFDSPGTSAFVWLANQVLTAAIDGERGRCDSELRAEMTAVFCSFERILLGAHLPAGTTEK